MSELLLFVIVFFPIIVAIVKSIASPLRWSDTLPTSSSAALRGYMALMILWGHDTGGYYFIDGTLSYPYPWVISALRLGLQCTGFLFVGIFFALSAYGCRQKWVQDQNYIKSFLPRRIINVWMPFVLIGISLGAVKNGIWGGTYSQLFLNCFDFNVWPVHWYIIFALLFYVAFYCVYSSVTQHQDVIMCIVILCYLSYCYIAKKNEVYYVSQIGLLIGILYSRYEKMINLKKNKFLSWWAILFVVFLVIYNYPFLIWPKGIYISILNDGPIYRMISVGLICICAFFMLHFVDFSKSRWLRFLGTISMEIYLIHSFCMMLTDAFRIQMEPYLSYSVAYGIKTILTICFTIILALVYQRIIKKIKRYMLGNATIR
ncbi:MAG: acyltransferase family protein [Agathobaculum desmolans]|uniref:acyltransferase family protein n=1 Tax=Agathobaculum desmolans TaxID=39484 RepID=UPI003995EBD4